MEAKEFIGPNVIYDNHGQMIFAVKENGHHQMLLDLRGWGAIQNLFKTQEEAGAFQDDVGIWITDAINEKLNPEKEKLLQLLDAEFKFLGEERLSGFAALRIVKGVFEKEPSPQPGKGSIVDLERYSLLEKHGGKLPSHTSCFHFDLHQGRNHCCCEEYNSVTCTGADCGFFKGEGEG